MRKALAWLRDGHGISIFPAGEVSHWVNGQRRITDPGWSDLPIRCVEHANATIVPMYFSGSNSLLFQVAGMVHPRLRTARLPGELLNKRGRTVEVRIGSPIAAADVVDLEPRERAIDYVRARTYVLAHRQSPAASVSVVRFPKIAFKPPRQEPVAPVAPEVEREIEALDRRGACLARTDPYAIYVERGTMQAERMMPLAEKPDDSAPYFAIVLVTNRWWQS
jgi:hypothetical protein